MRALVGVAAPHPLGFPGGRTVQRWRSSSSHRYLERRIMADDGLYIEKLLRSWAADGAGFLTATEARHYRDALMLWPSPHCALNTSGCSSATSSGARAATFAGPPAAHRGAAVVDPRSRGSRVPPQQ